MTKKNRNSLKVNADNGCFVCGNENPIGLHVEFNVDQEQNRADATLTVGNNFQGWQGVVHGGIITTLLDETAIYACRTLAPECVTAGITVRFKRPVRLNTQLVLQAEVLSVKRRIALVSSRLTVETKIMAEAEVKVMLLENNSD